MKLLLIFGCIALGILLVAATHEDQPESEIEAKHERIQKDFVNVKETRPTGRNGKKKIKLPRMQTPGAFSPVSKVPFKTLEKRNIKESLPQQGKRRRCPGCFTPLTTTENNLHMQTSVLRNERDTEEHEKLKKKQKHIKDKSKSKRRRNKNHREKHTHTQEEGTENNKKRKHHRGKDKQPYRSGMFAGLSRRKGPPDTTEMHKDISDIQDMSE